jgi:hypothetical protein
VGSEQKKIIASWIFALGLMVVDSSYESLRAIWAVVRHPAIEVTRATSLGPKRTELKREEQRYFLSYGIYLPLDDIMFQDELIENGARHGDSLRSSCGGAKSGVTWAIWLPLKFRWPLIGERVSEWCWKPTIIG